MTRIYRTLAFNQLLTIHDARQVDFVPQEGSKTKRVVNVHELAEMLTLANQVTCVYVRNYYSVMHTFGTDVRRLTTFCAICDSDEIGGE